LSSRLLSKNLKIKIHRTITFTYCLVWVREEQRLRIFENRVLKRIFGPKREEVVGG
jgi:PAS domain-containing protein